MVSDCLSIETSVRTPLEAVYQLTGLQKDVIEVHPSQYDMRYFLERMKKFAGVHGDMTEHDLPKVNLLKIGEMKAKPLKKINQVPPYYVMYPGLDKSVAQKESVLDPQYPKEK